MRKVKETINAKGSEISICTEDFKSEDVFDAFTPFPQKRIEAASIKSGLI